MFSDEWGTGGDEFDDDFAFEGENFGEGDLEKGGAGTVKLEGVYHFDVSEVKPELGNLTDQGQPKASEILFILTVLETVPGQSAAGTKLFHRIQLKSKDGQPPADSMVKAALRFGVALDLLECKEINGNSVTVIKGSNTTRLPASMWAAAKGRQVIGKVQHEKESKDPKTGKTYKEKWRVNWGDFWHPADPDVADTPKNLEALQTIGIRVAPPGSKPPVANGAKPAAQAQAAKAQPVAAAAVAPFDDDLGDL